MKTGYLYSVLYGSSADFAFCEEKKTKHYLTVKNWREIAAIIKVEKIISDEFFKLYKYEIANGNNNHAASTALANTLVYEVPAFQIKAIQAPATFEDVKDCHAAGHMSDFSFEIAERYFLEG